MNKKYKYLIIVFLIVATFVAFGRIVANDFINFDDDKYITENNNIKSGINPESIKWAFTSSHASNWHPLTWISHMLDWRLFGANAAGHHLVSLLLHIGSAILLFLFLNKTTSSIWPGAFVTAFFALHPLRVESVAWAAERKDVLSMFLGLAVLYTYALYVEKPKLSKYYLCLILFAASLLAKPMLVTLPFVLLLLDYWPLERWQKAFAVVNVPLSGSVSDRSDKKKTKQRKDGSTKEKKISMPLTNRAKIIHSLLWEKSPFIFLAIVSSIMTIWAQNKGGAVASLEKLPFLERILNAIVSYVAYLLKIFWPVNLAVFYPYEQFLPSWQVFGAALILLGISIAVIYAIKKAPFLFVGWFWYLGTLIPVIGLMQVGKQSMADRYTYLPSIGIGIMIAWGAPYFLPKEEQARKKILISIVSVLLTALIFLTWQQCGYWKNSVVLYDHVLKVTKNNDLAHYNLANELVKQKNTTQAIAHYFAAIKINPYYSDAHSNLGAALAVQGKNEEAIAHYLAAIKINPDQEEAHSNLGVVLAAEGRAEEAIAHYLMAIKINPNYDDAYYNLANLFMKQGKIKEAIENYRQAIKINPDHYNAHFNLASVLLKERRLEEAIDHFRSAARITPSSFAALNNLGVYLEKQLKHDEAIYYYRQALQLEPQNPGIYFNLGVALGNKGELKEAIENFRHAIYLKPDYEVARRALKLAQEINRERKR
jgi:tetratricopeptide (TPR) repeat protein